MHLEKQKLLKAKAAKQISKTPPPMPSKQR
jgi:hypothetical protein